jgi:bile acid:Na+ symporter, BASS family
MSSLRSSLNIATNLFPVWVLAAGVLALFQPALFTWFSGPWIVWGLAVIMLGMGMTLSIDDFRDVLKMPRTVAIGFIAQYTIMPFMGWASAKICALPPQFAAGLILVACCPGGTASNVVTYLARANVALSVLMTMCSTFGAVLMTPLLTKALAGTYVPVNAWGLFLSTAQVVLIPLLVGLALHEYCPKLVAKVLPAAPLVSVVTIALICASIIGQSAELILNSGAVLLLAVFLLHAGGFFVGYWFARLFGYDESIRRTISIEVGMQNSGLGAVLARQHFSPAAAVPCAISSVFHSVIGSLLAAVWRLSAQRTAASNELANRSTPSHPEIAR